MTSAGIIAICAILTFAGLKTTYYIIKVLAGVSYFGLGVWWVQNPLGGDPTQPAQTVMVLLAFVAGIAMFFMPMWYSKFNNGQEVEGRFRLPFMHNDDEEELERQRRHLPNRSERVDAYLNHLDATMRGERRRR